MSRQHTTPKVERIEWDGAEPDRLAVRLRAATPTPERIAGTVAELIAEVRERGDAALHEQAERFDGVRLRSLRVERGTLERALERLDPGLRSSLEAAAENVRMVAEAQAPAESIEVVLPQGHTVRVAERAVAAAAVYVPGGRAPYPSTALMGVIPARVAGVERVIVATPPLADGLPDRTVLAASALAGANELYAIGGAGAIAALAYGTESLAPVDVIAGPGGPWVQEAKLQVSRRVGIDGYAGPSELLVICDSSVPARWVALDLCAQAEHGDDGLLAAVSPEGSALEAIEQQLVTLATEWEGGPGARLALITAPDLEAALVLAEELAPEHLELAFEGAERAVDRVRTAGCAFVGAGGATALGDYAAGSNHVLPTGGAGRFQGPLGPATFRKRTSVVAIDAPAAEALAPLVEGIAKAEGFPVHAESARARASGPTEQAS